MTYDEDDTPAARFERFLASVEATMEPRPRHRPKPARWWHFVPVALFFAGAAALGAWGMGRSFEAW